MSIDDQVAEFHRVMGIPDRSTPGLVNESTLRLRMRLVLEEAFELAEACLDTSDATSMMLVLMHGRAILDLVSRAPLSPDLPGIADALGDIDYVVAGTRLQLGIRAAPVADAIHAANMAKAPGGVVSRDAYGKVLKPFDWSPPDIAGALRAQGWRDDP